MQAFSRAAGAALAAAAIAAPAVAQGPASSPRFDSTGVSDTSMFAPITLPSANVYRTGSGAPGPKYWQNRADYRLEATLDTEGVPAPHRRTDRYTTLGQSYAALGAPDRAVRLFENCLTRVSPESAPVTSFRCSTSNVTRRHGNSRYECFLLRYNR